MCDTRIRDGPAKNLTVYESNRCESRGKNVHTNLIHNHPESVTVGLLRWSGIEKAVPVWIQQFWTHPTSSPTRSERHEGCFLSRRDQGGAGYGSALHTNNGRETKVRETGTETLVDEDIRLIIAMSAWTSGNRRKPYPLQVAMHHVNAVHVLQSVRSIGQLSESVVSLPARSNTNAHELDTINPPIFLDKLTDITVIHLLRHHRKPTSFQIYTNKWQDVRMSQVSPSDDFSAKFLSTRK